MTLEYNIDEQDFLAGQLFIASKSDRIKKKRQKNKMITVLAFGVLGILMLTGGKIVVGSTAVLFALLSFFIYPIWERRQYVRHYEAFIKENYKDRIGKVVLLEINGDYIYAKESGGETKVLTSEIQGINEIPALIIVRINGGYSFVLPKGKLYNNIDLVRDYLKELADQLSVEYSFEENWEWK